ncbi:alpha/beta hydrolase [Pseudaminobacter sp. 19-2017]|uniref:Alpha/beta hydrolase n=1 Tax=Pseudaminobacter soli (ex Zhang et al. 2022) TaxID=2831468 RepID=A0A942EA47_9HYPH|nr:alpha/beta hydrolase [Pseudaminobacter soli]MBS3651267.1 alpha/beta hydrolase [Pseudaminobacter soli]
MRPAVDYSNLIDRETWAFIDRVNSFYPPEAIDWPIEKNRTIYNGMSREFHAGHPAGVAAETTALEADGRSIPVRIYHREAADERAVILYLHGGGFVLGDLESHDDICAELCAGTGFTAVSIDYRLAPEHTGTAAFDDAMAGLQWVSERFGRPIVLVGESAGASVAASLSHNSRRKHWAPGGQILIYPSLGGDLTKPSMSRHAEAPLLSAKDVAFYRTIRTGGQETGSDPRFEALADSDFSDLPPTVIFTAECDPLASEGPLYAGLIEAAGGKACSIEEKGLPHGYLRGRRMARRAGESFARIISATAALGRGEWPY